MSGELETRRCPGCGRHLEYRDGDYFDDEGRQIWECFVCEHDLEADEERP